LAVDAEKRLVVIELKVSRSYDRVIGQILRYMAWIEKNHAEPEQRVRGVIVAREISEDLRLACSYLPAVGLYEYELSVLPKRVELEASRWTRTGVLAVPLGMRAGSFGYHVDSSDWASR